MGEELKLDKEAKAQERERRGVGGNEQRRGQCIRRPSEVEGQGPWSPGVKHCRGQNGTFQLWLHIGNIWDSFWKMNRCPGGIWPIKLESQKVGGWEWGFWVLGIGCSAQPGSGPHTGQSGVKIRKHRVKDPGSLR